MTQNVEAGARLLTFSIARIGAAALMAEFAAWALKRGEADVQLSLNRRGCAEELYIASEVVASVAQAGEVGAQEPEHTQ